MIGQILGNLADKTVLNGLVIMFAHFPQRRRRSDDDELFIIIGERAPFQEIDADS